MQVRKFSFKNLCSYGNKLQSFEFSLDPQLVLVEGKNGGGKSTISDALTFAIYGKSAIRKTKELPNRLNKNGYTHIDFLTNAGQEIQIERGLEPNFSRLSINGAEHNLPDKRRTDDFIEEQLAKMPFNVFSNTISLSVNDFKSFVKLSPSDKRQIIDRIFGLEIVNDMSKKNKEELKTLKLSLTQLDAKISSNESTLIETASQLKAMKTDIDEAKIVRKKEIEDRLVSLNNDLVLYKKNYSEIGTKIKELEESLSKSRDARTSIELTVAEYNKKLRLYENNKQCPHCLSDLTDANHSKIKDDLIKSKEDEENRLPAIETEIAKAKSIVDKEKKEQEFAKNRYYQIDGLIKPLKNELAALDSEELDTDGTVYLEELIAKLEKANREAKIEREKITDQVKVLQELEEAFSDKGMKQLLMSQIIPILNKKILRTSKVLDFPFSFEFDMNFEPVITQLGIQISPDSLSTGEQKKMNLIVLLGIIELIKLKNHSVNLLFLDEIFSSLDVESIYRVVDLLKSFSKKYKMTIFVISHDPLPEELFDRKLSVSKVDHFSDITFS